jgi:hypothetical protein
MARMVLTWSSPFVVMSQQAASVIWQFLLDGPRGQRQTSTSTNCSAGTWGGTYEKAPVGFFLAR